MAVKFKDYYETLGVSRTAAQEEIPKAYRKLARKHHPDVNKDPASEDRFKAINEAYEVLKDPDKRRKYDQLGQNWEAGQDFRPPPGWEFSQGFQPGGAGGRTEFRWSGGGGDFSEFFETLFGGQGRGEGGRAAAGGRRRAARAKAGADQEAVIRIVLEDAFHGGPRTVALQSQTTTPEGRVSVEEKTYEVKIPAGIRSGQKIRLSGEGEAGTAGGRRGDLYLKVEVEPHPYYRIEGLDLYADLLLSPWEAVLGAAVDVPTLSGTVTLKVPPGTQSGQKLRLRGRGMPNPKGAAGDFYVIAAIMVPKTVSKEEKELFERLREVSAFNPRA